MIQGWYCWEILDIYCSSGFMCVNDKTSCKVLKQFSHRWNRLSMLIFIWHNKVKFDLCTAQEELRWVLHLKVLYTPQSLFFHPTHKLRYTYSSLRSLISLSRISNLAFKVSISLTKDASSSRDVVCRLIWSWKIDFR